MQQQLIRAALFAAALVSVGVAPGCRAHGDHRPEFKPGRANYDTSPIDISNFVADPAVQQRVLYMPFGEIAARLGSLTLAAASHFRFSRGSESFEQQDSYRVEHDSGDNFHLQLTTPQSSMEFYLAGEMVAVRLDKGPLRSKPRREVETDSWTELANAGLHQSLDLFRPRLTFRDATAKMVDGRACVRVTVGLGPTPDPTDALPAALPESALPRAAPSKWRELAKPLDLEGFLWIDSGSGALVKADIRGKLEVADRDVRPTQLTLSYAASISDIGKTASIVIPKSVPEFKRMAPPRDLLSFFRDKVPLPAAESDNLAAAPDDGSP